MEWAYYTTCYLYWDVVDKVDSTCSSEKPQLQTHLICLPHHRPRFEVTPARVLLRAPLFASHLHHQTLLWSSSTFSLTSLYQLGCALGVQIAEEHSQPTFLNNVSMETHRMASPTVDSFFSPFLESEQKGLLKTKWWKLRTTCFDCFVKAKVKGQWLYYWRRILQKLTTPAESE